MVFNVSYITNPELNFKNIGNHLAQVTMHSGTTGPSSGTELNVSGMGSALIDMSGFIVGEIQFEGKATKQGSWHPIQGKNLSTGKISSKVYDVGQYLFNVNGYHSIRVSVIEATNVSLTVIGVAIPTTVDLGESFVGDRFEFQGVANPLGMTSTGYRKYDQPYLNIKVLDSQGLVYIELQEETDLGANPKTIEQYYANNETFKFDIRGRGRLRLSYRVAYRGSEGIELEPIRIAVWGSES